MCKCNEKGVTHSSSRSASKPKRNEWSSFVMDQRRLPKLPFEPSGTSLRVTSSAHSWHMSYDLQVVSDRSFGPVVKQDSSISTQVMHIKVCPLVFTSRVIFSFLTLKWSLDEISRRENQQLALTWTTRQEARKRSLGTRQRPPWRC